MPNPTVGEIICPLLGDIAEVRRDKNQKLYYVGQAGIISPKSASGQAWLKEHAQLFDTKPDIDDTPQTADIEREPTAKSGGLFDGLINTVWGADDE